MTARVINDPSALGWEYDPATGRWTWGGHSSSGGGGGGSFPEAPVDGEQYARQNAGWSVVDHPEGGTGGGTVTTADVQLTSPTTFVPGGLTTQEDANNYIGEELEKIIPDAPANGTIYGRQNNGWVSVPTGGGGSGGNDPRISDQNISNWNTSFGWGDHKSQGYLTSAVLDGYATESWVSVNYQPKGSYLTPSSLNGYATQTWVSQQGYATQSWVGQNYQPKGSYLTSESDPTVPAHVKAITTTDINKWNNPPAGGGGTDTFDDVVSRGSSTNTSPSAPNWQCLSNTYTLGGVAGAGARIVSYDGRFNFYNSSNGATGTINTNGNIGGTSFTSTVNNVELVTMYGNALANSGSLGAGFYFTNTAASPQITPCIGAGFVQVDNTVSLGNPNKRWAKVWSVGGVGSFRRHTQNDGEAVLSVKDLIEVFESLREATKEEKTMEGLRDSIGNCVGGIVERLEAIQAATDEQTAQEIAMYAENEDEPMPPFPTEPLLPPVE
jgi:hypothetical protein